MKELDSFNNDLRQSSKKVRLLYIMYIGYLALGSS